MSWPLVDLKDVAFFQEGPGIRNWQFRDSGIKLVNVKNIVNGVLKLDNSDKYLDESEVQQKYSHFLVEEGDLLMASSGATWGKTAWVERQHLPICMNTSMIRFQALDKNILSIEYLAHYLNGPEFKKQMGKLITGSAQPNFGSTHLKQIQFPLPPLEEQKRIAAILDKADAIRRKRQQAIKLADDFLRSVFLEMFGDPVTNPKGWEVKSLKDLVSKIGSGSTPRGGKEAYVKEGISLVRSLNVHDDEFLHKNLAFITDKQAKELSNVSLEKDDVLLNITGASVCRCALVDNSVLPARVNQHVCIIRPKKMEPEFLLHTLISKSFKQQLLKIAQSAGATREALTKDQVENLKIPVPPLDLQKKFANIKSRVKSMLAKASRSNEIPLCDSLSQKAFSGK